MNCGGCVRACRTNAVEAKEKGGEIFVGGRFGRGMRIGDSLGKIFKEEDIISTIDKIMSHYIKVALPGERISKTMDRLGKDKFLSEILK